MMMRMMIILMINKSCDNLEDKGKIVITDALPFFLIYCFFKSYYNFYINFL